MLVLKAGPAVEVCSLLGPLVLAALYVIQTWDMSLLDLEQPGVQPGFVSLVVGGDNLCFTKDMSKNAPDHRTQKKFTD